MEEILRGSFLTTALLLRKISDRQFLETKPPTDKMIFAQLCSIDESFKSFKSRDRNRKTLKLKGHIDLKNKISANR